MMRGISLQKNRSINLKTFQEPEEGNCHPLDFQYIFFVTSIMLAACAD